MLISFEELTNNVRTHLKSDDAATENEWLFHEIMRSLPPEVIEQAQQRREFNVQLRIDNIVVEPQLLNDIFKNIDKYISDVSDKLMKDKLAELESRFQDVLDPLEEATGNAVKKIREEFNIKEEEL